MNNKGGEGRKEMKRNGKREFFEIMIPRLPANAPKSHLFFRLYKPTPLISAAGKFSGVGSVAAKCEEK